MIVKRILQLLALLSVLWINLAILSLLYRRQYGCQEGAKGRRKLIPKIETYFDSYLFKPREHSEPNDITAFGMLCEQYPDGTIPAVEASLLLLQQEAKTDSRRIIILLMVTPVSSSSPYTLADYLHRRLRFYIEKGYVKIILAPLAFYANGAKNYVYARMSVGGRQLTMERMRIVNLGFAYMMWYASIHGYNMILYDDTLQPKPNAIDTVRRATRRTTLSNRTLSIRFGPSFLGSWFSARHMGNLAMHWYKLPYLTDLNLGLRVYDFCSLLTDSRQGDTVFVSRDQIKVTNFDATIEGNVTFSDPAITEVLRTSAKVLWLSAPKEGQSLIFRLSAPHLVRNIHIITGLDKYMRDPLTEALLEASYDHLCKDYVVISNFKDGLVKFRSDENDHSYVFCLRVKITADQSSWAAIRYFRINE